MRAVALVPAVRGIVPGAVDIVVRAVQLYHVPRVLDVLAGDVTDVQSRQSAEMAEGERVALADGDAVDQRVVGVIILIVVVVFAVRHEIVVQEQDLLQVAPAGLDLREDRGAGRVKLLGMRGPVAHVIEGIERVGDRVDVGIAVVVNHVEHLGVIVDDALEDGTEVADVDAVVIEHDLVRAREQSVVDRLLHGGDIVLQRETRRLVVVFDLREAARLQESAQMSLRRLDLRLYGLRLRLRGGVDQLRGHGRGFCGSFADHRHVLHGGLGRRNKGAQHRACTQQRGQPPQDLTHSILSHRKSSHRKRTDKRTDTYTTTFYSYFT